MNKRFLKAILLGIFFLLPLSACQNERYAENYEGYVVLYPRKGGFIYTFSIDDLKDGKVDIRDCVCNRKYHLPTQVQWLADIDFDVWTYQNIDIDNINNEVLDIVDQYEPNYYNGYGFMYSMPQIMQSIVFEAPERKGIAKDPGVEGSYHDYHYSISDFDDYSSELRHTYDPSYIPTIDHFHFDTSKIPAPEHRSGYTFKTWKLKPNQD